MYPHAPADEPAEPVHAAGHVRQAPRPACPSYETRHCDNGPIPTIANTPTQVVAADAARAVAAGRRCRRACPTPASSTACSPTADAADRGHHPVRLPERARACRASRRRARSSRRSTCQGEQYAVPAPQAERASDARPRGFERVVRAAARRPRAGAGRARGAVRRRARRSRSGLQPSAATSTLAGRSSDTYQATERYRERFGDHAIVVLVRGPLQQLVLTENLGRLLGARGLPVGQPAGRARPRRAARARPCAELARDQAGAGRLRPGHVHQLGGRGDPGPAPGAGSTPRAREAERAAARRARARAPAGQVEGGAGPRWRARPSSSSTPQFVRDLLQLNLKYGLGVDETPRLDDPDFVSTLVFDPSRGATTPKARFAYLFPSSESAAIQVRLKPGLSDARARAGDRARARGGADAGLRAAQRATATRSPACRCWRRTSSDALAGSVARLLLVAVVVMAAVLALVFRRRLRLVPLAVALGAVALTFGLMALVGAPLTMASIAVLPVLLGLAVDYAIQYQARIADPPTPDGARARRARRPCRRSRPRRSPPRRASSCCCSRRCRWCAGSACCSSSASASRSRCALTGGTAALVRARPAPPRAAARSRARRAARASCSPPRRGRCARLAAAGRGGWARRVLRAALARARAACSRSALAVAALGWVADTQTEVRSDLQALVPQDLPAVRDLDTLQRTTGVAGEVDVVVEGRDLADPEVVAWMRALQQRVLQGRALHAENGCGKAALCPALSLPDLFQGDAALGPREDRRAARRRAAVLLPGGHHRRPAHRQPRVRHPAHAARRAARGDRADARGARPAARA